MGAALRMEAVQQEWKRRKELEMVCDVSPVAVPASAKRARLASCSAPEYTLHIAFVHEETINKHRATHLITVSAFTSRLKLC